VLVGYVIPLIGWMLLCKGSSHFAHVDPHPGNFQWDAASGTLWVLDWGSCVTLSARSRRYLCMLVSIVAEDAEDELIADTARSFGLNSSSNRQLALVVRGLLNATAQHAAQDTLSEAALDRMLAGIADEVVPVVRCLVVLGGLMKELRRRIYDDLQQEVPLSLDILWKPFAVTGLQE